MARKVFISFLGTSPYKEVNYTHADKSYINRFIQVSTLKILCSTWTSNDIAYFCLTDTAKSKNWLGDLGLENEIKKHPIPMPYELVAIPEDKIMNKNKDANASNIQSEIWDTFQIVYNHLQDNDEIYFDITHSFRYMPMLINILLHYAKATKNVKIIGLSYGAFEVLGFASAIDENYPNIEDRKAPIVNLLAFSELQDWTNAAADFVNFGYPKTIAKLTNDFAQPLNKEAKGQNLIAKTLMGFAKNIELFSNELNTNRGLSILKGGVLEKLRKSISEIKATDVESLAALKPLFSIIENKVKLFKSDTVDNGFAAVRWSIEHNWIQQGITMLQENTITYLCAIWQEKYNLSYTEKTHRNFISSILNVAAQVISEEKWERELRTDIGKTKLVLAEPILLEITKPYNSLSVKRNDINHGGFTINNDQHPFDSTQFKKPLIESYNAIVSVIYKNAPTELDNYLVLEK